MIDDPSDDELLAEIKPRKKEKVIESKAKNERQYWVDLTRLMLKVPYVRVAKMVEGWKADWIRDMYLQVNKPEINNPAALWWWTYRNPK